MTLPGQMELATVIDHDPKERILYYVGRTDETHKPLGVRLAKMLGQYDDSPSSQLWSDIQWLAREILHASR